jgi:hypothetical protein
VTIIAELVIIFTHSTNNIFLRSYASPFSIYRRWFSDYSVAPPNHLRLSGTRQLTYYDRRPRHLEPSSRRRVKLPSLRCIDQVDNLHYTSGSELHRSHVEPPPCTIGLCLNNFPIFPPRHKKNIDSCYLDIHRHRARGAPLIIHKSDYPTRHPWVGGRGRVKTS